jgi:hypothetical protein
MVLRPSSMWYCIGLRHGYDPVLLGLGKSRGLLGLMGLLRQEWYCSREVGMVVPESMVVISSLTRVIIIGHRGLRRPRPTMIKGRAELKYFFKTVTTTFGALTA